MQPWSWRLNPRSRALGSSAGGGAAAPVFLNAATFSAPEGSDYDYLLETNEPCTFLITGGAQANQYQLNDETLTLFSQAYSGVSDDYVVTVEATSIATGLTATQNITGSVTDIAAPVNTVAPAISANDIEGGSNTLTPGTFTGTVVSRTRQWLVGDTAGTVTTPIGGETALTYVKDVAVVGKYIRCGETASNGVDTTTAYSNVVGPIANGIIARLAIRGTSGFVSDPSRTTYVTSADTAEITRPPAVDNPTGDPGYTFQYLGSGSFSNTNAAYPAQLAGQINITGTSGDIRVVVPNTPLKVRAALSIFNTATVQDLVVKKTQFGATVFSQPTPVAASATTGVFDQTGTEHHRDAWIGDAAFVDIDPAGTELHFMKGGGGSATIRYIEITYPEFSQILAGTGPYYIANAGNDLLEQGLSGTPWAHIPGDTGAGGNVPNFNVQAGGFIYLNKGERHKPASYSARGVKASENLSHIILNRDGATGNPITYGAYGAGVNPVVDGTLVLASWSAAVSGDVFANPNLANIEKHTITGQIANRQAVIENGKPLAPASWPTSVCPYDYNQSYAGTDSLLELDATDYAAYVGTGANDSGTVLGYKECWIEHPDVLARYGTISLVDASVYYRRTNARFGESVITSHNTTTGRITFDLPNGLFLQASSPSSAFFGFAIRYHPFDLRTEGQYAVSADMGTLFIHAFDPGSTRSISRLDVGMILDKSFLTFQDMHFQGFGSETGNAIVTEGAPDEIALINVKVSGVYNNTDSWAVYFQYPVANFTIINLEVEDCQRIGGLAIVTGGPGTITGYKQRDEGRSAVYVAGSASYIDMTDIDLSDQRSAHGNGLTFYQGAHHITVVGFECMNRERGVSIQTDGTAPSGIRANTIKNGVITWPRDHPSASWSGAKQSWQGGDAEVNSLVEGVIVAGGTGAFMVQGTVMSTGKIIRNAVVTNLYKATYGGMLDVSFENCLIFNESGSGLSSWTGVTDYTDLGGVVFAPSDSWNGVITEAMREALTRNVGGSGYTSRTLGISTRPWVIPAVGTTFTLADVYVTTTRLHARMRADKAFASITGTKPSSTISLPAGITDNDLFGIDKGQLYPLANILNSPGDTLTLTIRETNISADNTGATTRDTVVVLNFY